MSIVNAVKAAINVVKGFFGGSSSTSSSSFSAPSVSSSAGSLSRTSAGVTNNITVNGALDGESTARQIVTILNNSSARGTLGSAAFA
jgi:hypothetical protein